MRGERGINREKSHQADGDQELVLLPPRHEVYFVAHILSPHLSIHVSVTCVIWINHNFKAGLQSPLPSDSTASGIRGGVSYLPGAWVELITVSTNVAEVMMWDFGDEVL